jgi:DNA-binding CsgD family transcriptional regulator
MAHAKGAVRIIMIDAPNLLEGIAVTWLEQSVTPLVLLTENQRLIWASASAQELMGRHALRVDALGYVKSDVRETNLKIQSVRRQVYEALQQRGSWKNGSVLLTFPEVADCRVQLQEMTAGDTVLIGCSIMRSGQTVQDLTANLAQYGLTKTERKVVSMLAQGSTAAEISRANGGSLLTVRTHIKRIYAKMNVNSREKMFARLTHREGDGPEGGHHAGL